MLTPSRNFTPQKGLICVMSHRVNGIPFAWCKIGLARMPISNLSYSNQILYFILFPLPDNTVLAVAGGAGGGALFLMVIIGILLCVLVMRKVRHAATKSQSKLCTLCFFFNLFSSLNCYFFLQSSFLSTDILMYKAQI